MTELEKAAREFQEQCRIANYKGGLDYPYDNIDMLNTFRSGAEWQSKQTPWISVEEKEPLTNKPILAMLGGKPVIMILSGWDKHLGYHPDIAHWMPIPSFDDILEDNKDVLKRMKEKGD